MRRGDRAFSRVLGPSLLLASCAGSGSVERPSDAVPWPVLDPLPAVVVRPDPPLREPPAAATAAEHVGARSFAWRASTLETPIPTTGNVLARDASAGLETSRILHFELECDYGPDAVRYRIYRDALHLEDRVPVAEGVLPAIPGAVDEHEAPLDVPRLRGSYLLRIGVRQFEDTDRGSLGVVWELRGDGVDLLQESARIHSRQEGEALHIHGIQEALDSLDGDRMWIRWGRSGLEVYDAVDTVVTGVRVLAFLAGPTVGGAVDVTVGVAQDWLESAVIERVDTALDHLDDSLVEGFVFRTLTVRCRYCETRSEHHDVMPGDRVGCENCGAGVRIHTQIPRSPGELEESGR